MHVVYSSWFSWGCESLLRFGIGGHRLCTFEYYRKYEVKMTRILFKFIIYRSCERFEYYRKYEVKMTRILFKFIIYRSCKRALKNGRVKSKTVRKLSLNFTFGQGSCLISDFTRPKSNKAVLVQVFLRFQIVIFNNTFVFCMMSSFCSMSRVAGWILAREITKHSNVFYPVCLKKVLEKARQTSVTGSVLWKLCNYMGKWGSNVKNRYHYATVVENPRINFSISPYCTLLFSRKENFKFFEVALPAVLFNGAVGGCIMNVRISALKYCQYHTGHLLTFRKTAIKALKQDVKFVQT